MSKRKKSQYVFGTVPTIRASRSRFDLSQTVKTSGNVGTLYPFYCQEVVPGDTFKIKSTILTRLTSAYLRPVMDNLFIDQYYFFVPSRLVYDKWAQVFGENKLGAWANVSPAVVPTFGNTATTGNIAQHDNVCAYLGLPVGQELGTTINDVSLLPFRAFALIYDEFFRDENNIQPMNVIKGATGATEVLNNDDWSPNNYLGKCPKVAKFHDYFTTCLPSPQKGNPVEVGTSQIPERILPVAGLPGPWGRASTVTPTVSASLFPSDVAHLKELATSAGYDLSGTISGGFDLQTGGLSWSTSYDTFTAPSNVFPLNAGQSASSPGGKSNTTPGTAPSTTTGVLTPANLSAYDPGLSLGAISVNDLRLAFQTQKMLEKDARGGTRYREYILSHFGVSTPDSRVQVPEFLGGKRSPLNVQQVAQTVAQENSDNSLASLGAYSQSVGQTRIDKSFVEHGYVIGVMCVRQHHTYQQGIERYLFRKERLDFYDPVFANIGEQPVYKKELYASAGANDVFGYNEAWADMRYRPSRVSGQMASKATGTLDIYHFADEYENAPTLSPGFINETSAFVDRTIAVPSTTADQFIFDIYVNNDSIREMPVYSVPSLIDHH